MGKNKGYTKVVMTAEKREAMKAEYLASPFRQVISQITLEDLKANREDIIAEINCIDENLDVKIVMTEMVKSLVMDFAKNTTVEKFVNNTINFNGIKGEYKNTLWGVGCQYSTQAEYQRAGLGSKWSK